MARKLNKLSPRFVASVAKPGEYSDGGNLYLVVDKSGAKRWMFQFRWGGKQPEMGIGGLSSVSLGEARERATEARQLMARGINPLEQRDVVRRAAKAGTTFGAFADALVANLAPGFRNPKHVAQWRMTLTNYAAPLRGKPLDQIGTDDVLGVLSPIWQAKHETASRLRGRIERVLDAAKAKGLRGGENPARLRGHLDHLLPKRRKLVRGHHPAMPYADVPGFMADLRNREANAALALRFTILNASRSGEVLGARWPEIDRCSQVWTVPAERMKAGREHRVPLSAEALGALDEAERLRGRGITYSPASAGDALCAMRRSTRFSGA